MGLSSIAQKSHSRQTSLDVTDCKSKRTSSDTDSLKDFASDVDAPSLTQRSLIQRCNTMSVPSGATSSLSRTKTMETSNSSSSVTAPSRRFFFRRPMLRKAHASMNSSREEGAEMGSKANADSGDEFHRERRSGDVMRSAANGVQEEVKSDSQPATPTSSELGSVSLREVAPGTPRCVTLEAEVLSAASSPHYPLLLRGHVPSTCFPTVLPLPSRFLQRSQSALPHTPHSNNSALPTEDNKTPGGTTGATSALPAAPASPATSASPVPPSPPFSSQTPLSLALLQQRHSTGTRNTPRQLQSGAAGSDPWVHHRHSTESITQTVQRSNSNGVTDPWAPRRHAAGGTMGQGEAGRAEPVVSTDRKHQEVSSGTVYQDAPPMPSLASPGPPPAGAVARQPIPRRHTITAGSQHRCISDGFIEVQDESCLTLDGSTWEASCAGSDLPIGWPWHMGGRTMQPAGGAAVVYQDTSLAVPERVKMSLMASVCRAWGPEQWGLLMQAADLGLRYAEASPSHDLDVDATRRLLNEFPWYRTQRPVSRGSSRNAAGTSLAGGPDRHRQLADGAGGGDHPRQPSEGGQAAPEAGPTVAGARGEVARKVSWFESRTGRAGPAVNSGFELLNSAPVGPTEHSSSLPEATPEKSVMEEEDVTSSLDTPTSALEHHHFDSSSADSAESDGTASPPTSGCPDPELRTLGGMGARKSPDSAEQGDAEGAKYPWDVSLNFLGKTIALPSQDALGGMRAQRAERHQGSFLPPADQSLTFLGQSIPLPRLSRPMVCHRRIVQLPTVLEASRKLEIAEAVLEGQEVLHRDLTPNGSEAASFLLERLLTFTDSEIGCIASVGNRPNGERFFQTHAMSNIGWTPELREWHASIEESGMELNEADTVFGFQVETSCLTICNAPQSDGRFKGVPAGHPEVVSFMSVPLLAGPELVGFFAVANKDPSIEGYCMDLVEEIKLFTRALAHVVMELRKRRQAQDEVGEDLDVGNDIF